MIKLDKQTYKKYLDAGIIKEVDGKVYTAQGIEVYKYGRKKPKAKVSKSKGSN